ncbi:MAG TPA: condensation domain-containing protein, partial [Verrucomicrobiae bacterium]|nr:condensation domain-containing protein [Verrucomicrobiae bacterium]
STLTAGGEIVLVTDDERRDTSRLVRILEEQQVQRLFVPFVALNQIAETAVTEGVYPSSLREIDTAGEQLKITPAMRGLFSRLPACRLVNHYGPSETHLVSTFALAGPARAWPELPPIGRPIANAPIYLLDGGGRLVPMGVPGELHVGGAGLARGYHARADLTADRFVPDPFGGEPGGRLYRTGDLARFRRDGELEFLGRIDLQIKVRGYRVEPGEIEAAILRHPAVAQAAVAAHDHRGGKRLAAYVVARPGSRVEPGEIRDHLAERLPEFMVPAAIVLVDGSLPTSPNGKVDRAALVEPDWIAEAGYVAPRSPEEEIVCGVFAEVLDLPRAGADDDFFDLGGHSLLATQVVSRVRRAFGVEIPLRVLFESPTPAGLAAAAAAARRRGALAPPPITRADARARRPLSFAQRRLWFLDRLEPGGAAYNLPSAVRLAGDLDVEALARTLTEIVRRHEALRTRFVEGEDGPEQIIEPHQAVALRAEPIGGSGAGQQAEMLRLLREEARRPFDLARGPMLRWRLLRLAPQDHVLLLVAHHISSDGWSMLVLVRELGALYRAFVSGAPPALPEPSVQYADWAAWQRAWLRGDEVSRQLEYWREELRGAPEALVLATDRERPAVATWSGATLDLELSADLRSRLERLARSEGATLHMALLAGYAFTMMRHSGQGEVVVGTPIANRRSAEAEDLVGFFVNALAIRVRGGGAATWRELIARVREASLGAYANQDVPFERVVEELQPRRALNRAPLFQTAFALQNVRMPETDLPGLSATFLEIDTGTAKFDVAMTLSEAGDRLEGSFEYNTDLFDRETVEGFATTFRAALEAAAADPSSRIDALAAVAAPEQARSLDALAGAPAAGDDSSLLHEIFERQAGRTPGAPALAGPWGALTYAEVDAAANRLANHLRAMGAAPDDRVAVVLERSPRALIAFLAILKAGAAYAPFDPAEPAGRLRSLVEDSGAAIVVTDEASVEALRGTAASLVALDRDEPTIASASAAPPRVTVRPENLACVVFTSGSSGRPKGVGVEHRQITSYVWAAVQRLGIEPGWRFAVVSTLSADLGNTAIYAALATGGCLHMIPREIAFDARAIEEYFDAHAIDALKIVPSHMQALMGGAHPERAIPARLLILGGESTPGSRLALFEGLRPGCRVANHYGPTEATVGAIAGLVDRADGARGALPLGRPLANARALVLDAALHPAPRGVPGEIYLGGSGVARGYLGRP